MTFELTEIVTKDKLVHQGIYSRPTKPGKKAILWVHGLTGRFYGDVKLMNLFAERCNKLGMGFASFNTRGHDVISSIRTLDPGDPSGFGNRMIGAGMERFEECVWDIASAVAFLAGKGFSEVSIAGHSTGANKVCYYAATRHDRHVAGVVLAGPLSDRISAQNDRQAYEKNLTMLQTLQNKGKGESLLTTANWFPATADRTWSLIAPNTAEDVFNYGDTENILPMVEKITHPLLIVFSGRDEYADRPIDAIQSVFDAHVKSLRYKSVVIPDTTHGYEGKEREFVATVVEWVSSL